MANVPTQLSPGVNITEIDLSGIVREAGNNISGFVGQFRWGPASENLTVDNERRFTDIFLPPTNTLPEKMQDDFFTVTNYFRYSDKLKIVRVVHENARNARAGQSSPANPILIHNDEEFFAKADPTGVGAKNYSAVLSNANWIARYPGDVGNSIEVRAIGAGTFVQGSQNGSNNNNNSEPPAEPADTFYLPLKVNGSLLNGVTYAIVTVPQITDLNSNPNLSQGGTTWARNYIGDGSTLPSGNTFGVKYLCFYLKGSSYCSNAGTFPIPGGSYANIAGSNVAGGLTYSAYYRDRWFYGTFDNANSNDSGNAFWTKDGPLLAARLFMGISFDSAGVTWNRSHTFGKGFHQTGPNTANLTGQIRAIHPVRPTDGSLNSERYFTYNHVTGLISPFSASAVYPSGYYARSRYDQEMGLIPVPFEKDIIPIFQRCKPSTHITNTHISNPFLSNDFTFPNFIILPFDNSASALTEPVSNIFNKDLTYFGNSDINGITNAGGSVTRTTTAYRNYSTGRVVYKWGGSGITTDASDLANNPLRPVIDSFPGITAAGNKGMLIMMAYAQPISGITTGMLSTWHVGITTNSQVFIDNNQYGNLTQIATAIQNIDGLNPNGASVAASTNVFASAISPVAQMIHGISAEYEPDFFTGQVANKSANDPNATNIAGLFNTVFPTHSSVNADDPIVASITPRGAQAIPFKQTEISSITDIVIKKTDSN